jgi:hypothetical protein
MANKSAYRSLDRMGDLRIGMVGIIVIPRRAPREARKTFGGRDAAQAIPYSIEIHRGSG